MSKLSELEQRVLLKIKPRPEEYSLLLSTYDKIVNVLRKTLSTHGIEADITLQGSIAHDTWLSGDRDLDIFVLFPSDWSREDLEKKGFSLILEASKELGYYELRYAEHPYVRVKLGGVEADIVPGLKLLDPSSAKTAVDRTPFHTRYVNSVLNSELRDHVRLLKKFMKTIGVYGAEVKTRGFSGYAVELLVIAHNGFRNVLEAASKWKPPVFINTLGEKLTKDLMRELRSKYPDSCVYMPDPVDPLRNVTASVNLRSLSSFIIASRCYLKNPDSVFFEDNSLVDSSRIIESIRDRCIIFITYKLREDLPPDVIWGEAFRVSSTLAKILDLLDLRVIDYSAWTNERNTAVIGVELDECYLNKFKHYRGPCIAHEEERLVNFMRKHLGKGYGPWVTHNGCLDSLDRRTTTDVVELLRSRWLEFTVSPHFKLVKPSVEIASVDVVEWLISSGAGKWLRDFVLKTPVWMEKCIS